MNKTKIIINGKEYGSLDQVPEAFRDLVMKASEQADRPGSGSVRTLTTTTTKFKHNSREYSSLDEMPPQVRALFADKDGDGVPDLLQEARRGIKGNVNKTFKFSTTRSTSEAASAPPLTPSARELAQAEQAAAARQRDFESGGNQPERPDRPGFWSRLFGKKK